MRTHPTLVMSIFSIPCIAFSIWLAEVSSADDSSILTNTNPILAANLPASFDLAPLNVRISPSMITAGDQLSSMDYLVQNYSNAFWSGTVNVKVYIFEHGKSVSSGTLIQNHSFAGHFTAKSSQRVTVQSPVIIPPNFPKGSYKIGVLLDILDSNVSNNERSDLGATDIWVDAETTAPTIQVTAPTSNPTYSTDQATLDIWGTASDNVGVTEVTWVNSSTGAAGAASGATAWTVNGLSLSKGSNVISVTAKDAAGNKGTATLTVTYTPLDLHPPDTVITDGPSGIITHNSASFTFTGSDNVTQTGNLLYATYLQGYDGGWSDFTAATLKSYSNLPNGSYTFQVRAKDEAQNTDPTPATRSFTVHYTAPDTSPPETTITGGPDGTIASDSVTFTFTGSDIETQASNLVYATYLQGHESGWSDFSSSTSTTYNNLPNGSYTFQVRARDQAGNIDPTPARRAFTVAVTGCSYSVSSPGNTFGPGGGSGVVSVATSAGCSWTASTKDGTDWIRINSGPRRSGYGAVNYSVLANNTGKPRTGILTIAGQTLTVTQSSNEASCTYTLSVNVSPSGSGSILKNPEKDAYCPGDQVILNANSNSGYLFSSWRGVDSSNGATAHVTLNGNRTSTAFFIAPEEVKLPSTWTDEGNRYPLSYLGHSNQLMNYPLKIGDYYPLSFLFENSGDVEIEVTASSRMCMGLYSAATGRLLSYSNGLGDSKTVVKYPASGNMAYHLVITPCVRNVSSWTFSINGPPSSGDEIHLDHDFKGGMQGAIHSIYDRRFYSVTAPMNAARGLIVTLLPEQNFNGLLRLFDDRGDTLVASANNPSDGAIDVLTYGEVIPGQRYYICVEGYSAKQHQGAGNYELRVEFVK